MLHIPILQIRARTLPEGWEKSVIACWNEGARIRTEYDRPDDPLSRDCTMVLAVEEPFAEPRIHRGLPGGLEDLEIYRQEVLDGVRDHWIDPAAGKWEYTYHERLFDYKVEGRSIDQISYVVDKLSETPHTRRAQAVTWQAWKDAGIDDPACFCAGTKVLSPNGPVDIENLKDGDSVYAYDLSNGRLVQDKVHKFFSKKDECVSFSLYDRKMEVSNDQLLFTQRGWVKAKYIRTGDKLRIPSVCDGSEITDQMVIGFLHGDGWLSSGYCGGARKIKRRDLGFSIHPKADDGWIKSWLEKISNNKVIVKERYIVSSIAKGNSKKITITDKNSWQKFRDLGCPVGKKEGDTTWDLDNATDQECRDFLTGVYSAEGSIIFGKSHAASIELGMNWEECTDLISRILDRLGIGYSRYSEKNKKSENITYKIYVSRIRDIKKAVDNFDFRLDSRKQAKWLYLKSSILYSESLLDKRKALVSKARTMIKNGMSQRDVRKKISNYNSRWNDPLYNPSFRMRFVDAEIYDSHVMLPLIDKKDIGVQDVYDFEINHHDHAIIADGIVSHNCLQRLWFRILDDGLVCNVHIRSNDAYKAAFMNMFAFTELQRSVANRVSERMGRRIVVGQYVHIADSYHIYGSYFQDFERFLETVRTRSFEDRTWTTEFAEPFFEEGRRRLEQERAEGR